MKEKPVSERMFDGTTGEEISEKQQVYLDSPWRKEMISTILHAFHHIAGVYPGMHTNQDSRSNKQNVLEIGEEDDSR